MCHAARHNRKTWRKSGLFYVVDQDAEPTITEDIPELTSTPKAVVLPDTKALKPEQRFSATFQNLDVKIIRVYL